MAGPRRTTKTLLRRLVEKGHLTATAVGTSFLYRPARRPGRRWPARPTRCWTTRSTAWAGKLLAYMVKKSRLTPDDLARLRQLLDEHTAGEPRDDGEERRDGSAGGAGGEAEP